MDWRTVQQADRRVKIGLLITGLATFALLIISALKENVLDEWLRYRKEFVGVLEEKATDERGRAIADQFEVQIVQNVVPQLNVIDRCVTCHAGIDDPRMAELEQPFTSHPGKHIALHPPETFGCTVCHQGQGRATETLDAHGRSDFWDYPLLDKKYLRASCAKCHPESDLYGAENLFARAEGGEAERDLLMEGRELTHSKGCLGCHTMNGRGGSLGPDITLVGEKTRHEFDFSHFGEHEPREVDHWFKKHFLEPTLISPDTVMPDMGLTENEAEALTAFMLSLRRRDVPQEYHLAAQFPIPTPPTGHELYGGYCSACHGDDGQESDVPGIRTPALNNPDSLAVAGDDYYRFIIHQGRSGTNMPAWKESAGNLTRDEIDRIVAFIRGWEAEGAAPRDIFARSGDARIGGAYFGGLCANCHGRGGEGGIGNTLGAATFLGVATDDFLAETIITGRPGTAMPSWKHLPTQGVSDIVAHLRSWQPTAPTLDETRKSMAAFNAAKNVRVGKTLFAGQCAACHGKEGEGGIGLRLNTTDLLRAVDDAYFFTAITEGRPSTAMPAWQQLSPDQVGALIAYLRSWNSEKPFDLPTPLRAGDYDLGEVHYRTSCLGCHGETARGGVGPQLANPVLLKSVSDATLTHWIAHGRVGTAMKGFVSSEQGVTRLRPEHIADITAYLRHIGEVEHPQTLRTGVGDAVVGNELFAGNCASCHGIQGEGASGPQLNNPTFLRSASDGFLAATMVLGRSGTAMRSMVHGQEGLGQISNNQVQDIIAHMRLWDYSQDWRRPRAIAEMSARAIETGEANFAVFCGSCHGPKGRGLKDGPEFFAPALNNPEFLEAASDGFLLATIARGRSLTPMRSFGLWAGGIAGLSGGEISDIVSYIRTWQESHR